MSVSTDIESLQLVSGFKSLIGKANGSKFMTCDWLSLIEPPCGEADYTLIIRHHNANLFIGKNRKKSVI